MPYSTFIEKDTVTETAVLALGHRCTLTAARLWAPAAAADIYLQLFDAAATTDVTVGTTIPRWTVMLDFATGLVSGGDGLPSDGLVFDRGVVIACTSGPQNATAPGANTYVRLGIQ